jgi:cytochrome c-type biogenesis protein CcmF
MGTFIVRSGILVSVHAFAVDPWRGVFMLGLLILLIGTALCIYALKIHQIKQVPYRITLLSRTSLLLSNNILLTVAVFTILLGTLYPLIIEVLGLGKLSVGAPYFNTVFTPFAVLLLFFMGISYLIPWNQTARAYLVRKIIILSMISFTLSALLIILFSKGFPWKVICGLSLALWIILNTLQLLLESCKKKSGFKKIIKTQGAMLLAHLGVAILAIGIVLSSYYSLERDVLMTVGDRLRVGPYQFKLQTIFALQGANYTGVKADLALNNKMNTHLNPELRYYPVADMALSKPAIDAGLWRDLYIALAAPVGDKTWALRFYYKPFICWIWMGGLCMMLGGIWAILSKRYIKMNSRL